MILQLVQHLHGRVKPRRPSQRMRPLHLSSFLSALFLREYLINPVDKVTMYDYVNGDVPMLSFVLVAVANTKEYWKL